MYTKPWYACLNGSNAGCNGCERCPESPCYSCKDTTGCGSCSLSTVIERQDYEKEKSYTNVQSEAEENWSKKETSVDQN